MQKRFAVCCLLCLITGLFSVIPASAESSYLRGDANGDGVVSVKDVTAIQRCLAELAPDTTGMVSKRGNVTGSTLDITDATQIQLYLAEYDNIYSIGAVISESTQPTTKSYDLPFVPV